MPLITTTPDLGSTVLTEAVARYVRRYPATQVDLELTARVVDLVREGFDVALRIATTRLKSSSLVARKVGDVLLQL